MQIKNLNMRKLFKINFTIVFLLLLLSCGSSKTDYNFASGKVAYLSSEGMETISVRSSGIGKDETQAKYQAERLAFENLFFRGISSSNYNKPLVGIDEKEQLQKHANYFNEFFNRRMQTFILSSFQSTPKQKSKGVVHLTMDLKINTKSLKKDLEENGVIRKFGL